MYNMQRHVAENPFGMSFSREGGGKQCVRVCVRVDVARMTKTK